MCKCINRLSNIVKLDVIINLDNIHDDLVFIYEGITVLKSAIVYYVYRSFYNGFDKFDLIDIHLIDGRVLVVNISIIELDEMINK